MALCHPFLVLFLFLSFHGKSQFNFSSPEIESAYHQVLGLKVNSAKQTLASLHDSTNTNGIIPLLENYLDIITLLTVEDKELYKNLKPNENRRIAEIRKLDKNSPYYLYSLADIKLQWAFVELIYQDYVNGFLDLRKANDLIEKNIKLYPEFKLNNKVKGLIDLLTEASPEEANIALFAAGLKRNKDGKRKLIEVAVWEPMFKTEIDIYLTFVDAYVKNQEKLALWKIEKTYKNKPDNLFAQFTYLNILSKLNEHKKITALLDTNKLHKQPDYLYIPYLDFLEAESKMYCLELEQAISLFKEFVIKTSTPAFQKTASFKTALCYSALNKKDSANFFLNKVLTLPKSDLYLDEYSNFEADRKAELNSTLSFSRILFDAEEIKKCKQQLSSLKPFTNRALEIEKLYRLGRCEWNLGMENEALALFQNASSLSKYSDNDYYGAYSTFYCGFILKKRKENDKASNYFREVKKYKKHYYANHISKKADLELLKIEN